MQEIWHPSTNKLRKDGFIEKKSIEFAESNLLSVVGAEVKVPNIVDQHDI